MKKTVILGAFAFFMMVAVSWAQEKGTEKVLGPVIAVEREFALDLNACGDAFEKEIDEDNYISFRCKVFVFPKSDEEGTLSASLDDVRYKDRSAVLATLRNTQIDIYLLQSSSTAYEIRSNSRYLETYPQLRDVTKEDFLKVAKTLIDKFPKVSVKLIKVVK